MEVRNKQFYGLDFDRQKIIGNYIVDLYCKALGLVVEIDGITHESGEKEDEAREAYLLAQGCKVIRFTSTAVKCNMGQVLIALEEFILENYG